MLGPLLVFQTPILSPLDRMVKAVRSLHSVSGTLRGVAFGKNSTIHFRFLAPDCIDVEGEELGGRYVSDGATAWAIDPSRKQFRRCPPFEALIYARPVFGYNRVLTFPFDPLGSSRPGASSGPGQQDLFFNIPSRSRRRTIYPDRMSVSFDPKTGLPLGMRAPGAAGVYRYESIRLDPPLDRASFRFVPQKGYRFVEPIRSVPLRSLSLPMYPQRHAAPGAWTGDGPLAVRLSKVRTYGGSWVYDVEFREPGAFLWPSASATVRRGEEWRIATLGPLRDGGRRATVTVPRTGWPTPPDALFLNLTARKAGPGRSLTLVLQR